MLIAAKEMEEGNRKIWDTHNIGIVLHISDD